MLQERRKFPRHELLDQVGINVVQPDRSIPVNNINLGEGGLCLRLEEMLEVRSLVRLQVTPTGHDSGRAPRPVECTGRVAWVVQRLDLRSMPPFLFDVGIEFVDPPAVLRQWITSQGGEGTSPRRSAASRERPLEPAVIRGRTYVPWIERVAHHARPWHVVVSVDDVPCFSGHYASEREASAAWDKFRREQTRR